MASQTFQPIHFTDPKEEVDGNNKDSVLGALFLFFLFLFALLFVYLLYLCTHRRSGVNPNAPSARSAGLDPTALSGLPMYSYGSSCNKKPSPGAECAICLSVFQEGDMVKVLPLCRHGFHSDCVDKWLVTRSSCPLCRASVHFVDCDSVVP